MAQRQPEIRRSSARRVGHRPRRGNAQRTNPGTKRNFCNVKGNFHNVKASANGKKRKGGNKQTGKRLPLNPSSLLLMSMNPAKAGTLANVASPLSTGEGNPSRTFWTKTETNTPSAKYWKRKSLSLLTDGNKKKYGNKENPGLPDFFSFPLPLFITVAKRKIFA